ncbi:Hypothetical protein LUCI_3967 [Lucifera butyrica]|uniref:Uncharacterized protein n=1 Tax=Lucifera butyrica TaxID=1351585 RepID=A0A498RBS0_9FIRM|nr:hypothetical protein [Lucifera butyrica]VBB08689.1 Hypothetical protein LUCI_3967 [Lucifera butyrica]
MRKPFTRKTMVLDAEHMRTLHQESIDQLELMRTVLETAEQASGDMRECLDDMAFNHWQAYMDVLHMVCMHDESMNTTIRKYRLETRNTIDTVDRSAGLNRGLLLLLTQALLRRHRRFATILGARGTPMDDYLKETLLMEREHIAELVAMIQNSL